MNARFLSARFFTPSLRLDRLSASLLAGASLLFASCGQPGAPRLGQPTTEKAVPATELRGFGKVAAKGRLWASPAGEIALVEFTSEDAAKAAVLASKYVADLQAYGAVTPGTLPPGFAGAAFEVRHGGQWIVGQKEATVYVLSGPDAASLAPLAGELNASGWAAPKENAYPRYLDNFDNAALSIWWLPTTKPKEILDFFRDRIGIINLHPYQKLDANYAPGVYDHAAQDHIIAQARLIGKPYRFMIWGGIPEWWKWSQDPHEITETAPRAALYRSLFEAAGYKNTQLASPLADAVHMAALLENMNRYKDNPDLMAWMEPHGEFHLHDFREVPPGAQARFTDYLQKEKKLSLEEANAQFGLAATSWETFPYPEVSDFFGRKGRYVDLDAAPWRWKSGVSEEDGIASGFEQPGFDDSGWALDRRNSLRLQNEFADKGKTNPLWYRFTAGLPADAFPGGGRIYLHVMPYTEGKGGRIDAWVNGQPAKNIDADAPRVSTTSHIRFDVTELLQSGQNAFAIASRGGRIAYRVFLSASPGNPYPFEEAGDNRLWLAWNDYLVWEKLQTLTRYLQLMRTVDPNRPIKVMTPNLFQTEGMDLLERYGAYPQLTGAGRWFRPMHYKGYARLRGLPGSSEGGGPMKTDGEMQKQFAYMFWENQDAHDYVFDAERDFWSRPSVVEWWRQNGPLLRTLGKIDFGPMTVGLLRDTEQAKKYLNSEIWNWDLSRGPLPAAGVSPVLVDGPEFDRGMASRIPVVFDCATTVMAPRRVESILRYVKEGGTFVALHNTGRHSDEATNTWPLATALGLRIQDHLTTPGDVHQWPTAKIRFTREQALIPSLQGKEMEGSGISIDAAGNTAVGAVRITGDAPNVSPVATWEDGTMAVCEVALGKGRVIWMGTPFYLRIKDDAGRWTNAKERQALFKELLTALEVPLPAASANPEVWVEKRESKNGLYEVYLSGAMEIRGDAWKLSDTLAATLTLRDTGGRAVVEASAEGVPDQPATPFEGGAKLENLTFHPFQIRQFAVLRPQAGLDAPLHWLQIQKNQWRAITLPPPGSVPDPRPVMQAQAAALGEDGMDLSEAWKVRVFDTAPAADEAWAAPGFDATAWKEGRLGTWLANGWPDAVEVQYRRQATLPKAWLAGGRRVLLGFKAGWRPLGIRDCARLWVNGKLLPATVQNPMLTDITEQAREGTLDLALEVKGQRMSGGPCGVLYLRSVPAPAATLDLNGEWTTVSGWDTVSGTATIPGRITNRFGIRKTFELPADWAGARVRLVFDQGEDGNVDGMILNGEGYVLSSRDTFFPYGPRVDFWLKPGTNTIDFYPKGHNSFREQRKARIDATIRSIRLEKYETP